MRQGALTESHNPLPSVSGPFAGLPSSYVLVSKSEDACGGVWARHCITGMPEHKRHNRELLPDVSPEADAAPKELLEIAHAGRQHGDACPRPRVWGVGFGTVSCRAMGTMSSLYLSTMVMNTLPLLGSFWPAAIAALAYALAKLWSMPITSPVLRISGPSSVSAPDQAQGAVSTFSAHGSRPGQRKLPPDSTCLPPVHVVTAFIRHQIKTVCKDGWRGQQHDKSKCFRGGPELQAEQPQAARQRPVQSPCARMMCAITLLA